MKREAQLFFIGLFSTCSMAINACSQTNGAGSSPAPDVFVASTPCSAGTKPLPGIPKEAPCELIKWKLKLFGGKGKQISGTYMLDCDYGLPKQGTKNLEHDGSHLHREGKWIIMKGTATDPAAIMYRLDPDKPGSSVIFLRLNENLIHLLDSDQQLMIGNGAWSYTLNKIQQ